LYISAQSCLETQRRVETILKVSSFNTRRNLTTRVLFRGVGKIKKGDISFIMFIHLSVCLAGWLASRPHGTTRLLPDGFSWNWDF